MVKIVAKVGVVPLLPTWPKARSLTGKELMIGIANAAPTTMRLSSARFDGSRAERACSNFSFPIDLLLSRVTRPGQKRLGDGAHRGLKTLPAEGIASAAVEQGAH